MRNPYKDKSWFKFLSNKYVWVLLFFCTWMIFLDNYSYFDHRILDQQIEDLEDNAAYYKEEIKKDQENIFLCLKMKEALIFSTQKICA